jgi:diadenosine tetraphosphate (Ap4A) HIT family hydrolase
MADRFWDPEGKYLDGFIKEYNSWILEISFRQHTLGCYIIFSKEKVEKISSLSSDAIQELKIVMGEIESTLQQIPDFYPDRFNYLQLGNGLHNLHFHGIPRYVSTREFAGKQWIDTRWGHPPVWSDKETEKEIVMEIKKKIQETLSQ